MLIDDLVKQLTEGHTPVLGGIAFSLKDQVHHSEMSLDLAKLLESQTTFFAYWNLLLALFLFAAGTEIRLL